MMACGVGDKLTQFVFTPPDSDVPIVAIARAGAKTYGSVVGIEIDVPFIVTGVGRVSVPSQYFSNRSVILKLPDPRLESSKPGFDIDLLHVVLAPSFAF
jgi:hypothetical protein